MPDRTSEEAEKLREVKPLREPARPMIHCGVPMRKMQSPGVMGGVRTVWICAKQCGAQIMDPVKP